MTKNLGTAVVVLCGLLTLHEVVGAAESEVPEPFRGFDNNSKYSINYDELSELLRTVVVDVPTSDRAIAEPARQLTGTRMTVKVNKLTVNEGNRFLYETFEDNEAAQQYLLKLKIVLQQLPSKTPLEKFSREEQLAYWLNLYNVTVLNEVVAVYPKRNLRKLVAGKKSVFSKKGLLVAGIPLSLNDIQYTILAQNYNYDPLILYGLYQGIVGGPDIRTTAYNGDDVYRALEDNAYEFINSNRGTFKRDEELFRVSSFYKRNSDYFPDFESDLTRHLLVFLEGEERVAIQSAGRLIPDINDWTVTDLGGSRQEIGGSFAMNNAALLDSFRADHASVDGGRLTAIVTSTWEEADPDDTEDREDTDRIDSLGSGTAPVEGADVEAVNAE